MSNRWLYTLISFAIIIVGIGIIHAAAPNPGHTSSQVSFESAIDLGSNDISFSASDSGDIVFKTSTGTEKGRLWSGSAGIYLRAYGAPGGYSMVLYNNGNVGIGSDTTPDAKLDVQGDMIVDSSATIGGNLNVGLNLDVTSDLEAARIGVGGANMDEALELDVNGDIGANYYCDQNGANCKTAASLITTANTNYVRNVEIVSLDYQACSSGITISCPSGKKIIGGGCQLFSGVWQKSYPFTDGSAWFCKISGDCSGYAICANY